MRSAVGLSDKDCKRFNADAALHLLIIISSAETEEKMHFDHRD